MNSVVTFRRPCWLSSLGLAAVLALLGCSSGSGSGSSGSVHGPGVATVDSGGSYTSIQAAIDAAAEGSVIEIGQGSFAEELHVTKRLTIRGRGSGTRIQTIGTRSSSDDSSSRTRAGLTIRNASGVVLENMDFSGNPEDGIVIRESSNVVLVGIVANDNGDDGIDIRDSIDVRIESGGVASRFEGNGDRGVQVRGSASVTVEGARIVANQGDGVRVRESRDSIVRGNVILQNLEDGVRVRESGGVRVEENTISDNREYGVRVVDSPDTVLSGNDFGTGNGRGNLRRD